MNPVIRGFEIDVLSKLVSIFENSDHDELTNVSIEKDNMFDLLGINISSMYQNMFEQIIYDFNVDGNIYLSGISSMGDVDENQFYSKPILVFSFNDLEIIKNQLSEDNFQKMLGLLVSFLPNYLCYYLERESFYLRDRDNPRLREFRGDPRDILNEDMGHLSLMLYNLNSVLDHMSYDQKVINDLDYILMVKYSDYMKAIMRIHNTKFIIPNSLEY